MLFLQFLFIAVDAQKLYEKAYNEYKNGDLTKSVKLFDECIQKGEDTLHSYLYRGGANIFLGQYKHALSDLEKVTKIDSTTYRLHFFLGKLYLCLRTYDKALENYDIEIARYPNEAFAYEERAVVKSISEDYEGAFDDYKKAIELDSNNDQAYSNRGHMLITLKRYDEAINDLKKSIQIAPSETAFANLGLAHYLVDSNKLAIDDYTNALKLDPNDGESLYLRGVSYNKINMPNEACADFKRSLSLGYKTCQEMIDELHCN